MRRMPDLDKMMDPPAYAASADHELVTVTLDIRDLGYMIDAANDIMSHPSTASAELGYALENIDAVYEQAQRDRLAKQGESE